MMILTATLLSLTTTLSNFYGLWILLAVLIAVVPNVHELYLFSTVTEKIEFNWWKMFGSAGLGIFIGAMTIIYL